MRNTPPELPVCLPGEPEAPQSVRAAERLFGRLRPQLLRFAFWLCRDRALAEDVVQEALLRAWRARDSLKDPAASRGWLLTIVRREHARLYERKRLETIDLDRAIDEESAELAGGGAGEELGELRTAILKLPDEYRIPLTLQVMGGFSTAEIAAELQLSQAAVLTRLFRARNRLRVLYGLAPAPEEDPAP